ncbi:helix-turn-helix domain-containing protein [Corynebacterium striatum]|uniref:helix-turn-helix domain-containing protein n=1 Tax=Corynebacterium striatum TaxID=43770 RepID=UPI000673CCAF|nr:helix-turn-helix domain-containing protein [Corynebacterium striatum]EGT5575734.1 DNA-binding protein [Corynebacterium striatum]EGT5595048.1 DNA-binding protein [Corynebacterium striatum]EGT5788710.1 DNA-binding protein [Corynebacterium striatum]NHX52925.1 helix-turn-helix domain-containing protein [Corynebacterium striatum]NHY37537.1 helix-turn-helix domain-containing protein [Corynebacterium striatum]
MNPSKKARTYSVAETSEILGVSTRSLYRHVKSGAAAHLHPITVGDRVVFPRRVIDSLVEPAVSA